MYKVLDDAGDFNVNRVGAARSGGRPSTPSLSSYCISGVIPGRDQIFTTSDIFLDQ